MSACGRKDGALLDRHRSLPCCRWSGRCRTACRLTVVQFVSGLSACWRCLREGRCHSNAAPQNRMATRRACIMSSPARHMANARFANVPSLALVPLTELRTSARWSTIGHDRDSAAERRTDFAGCGAGETSRARAACRRNRAFARRCDRLHRRGDAAARGWPAVVRTWPSPTDGRCGRAISPARRPMRRCRCRRRRCGSKRATGCRRTATA